MMVSLEKTIMREWQNLQTVFRSENARVHGSRVSGSAACDLYVSNWDFCSQMECLHISCTVNESFYMV